MRYPKIKKDEAARLKECVGKNVRLMTTTKAHESPFGPEMSARDDWEQYGGHPKHVPRSNYFEKLILVAILGEEVDEGLVVKYIIGKQDGQLNLWPYKFESISWVSAIFLEDELLCNFSEPLSYFGVFNCTNKVERHRVISEQEYTELKKEFITIVP